MIEVIPGVYKIQLPTGNFPPGHVNAYLIRGDKGHLLVDTGWGIDEVFASLKKQLAKVGISVEDIIQVVLTHSHTDHAGQAGRLRHLSGAQIYLHKLEVEVIKYRYDGTNDIGGDHFLQQTDEFLQKHGVPGTELTKPDVMFPEVNFVPFPDVTLNGGETISFGAFSFDVLCTPGHSPGHISLYEPTRKVLFSGDLVLPTIVTSLGLHLQHNNNPLGDFLNSLNIIRSLEVNLVLPGHEHPFNNLSHRIEELVQCHEQKNAEIRETIADGTPKTAFHVALDMSRPPDSDRPGWYRLSQWDRRFTVLETIAHLQSMLSDKEMGRFSRDNTIYYQLMV